MVHYLIASDLMIELEEAEHARYLEKFVQKSVRLTYCDGNQFSFVLEVSFIEILLIKMVKYKSKMKSWYSFQNELGEIATEIENNSIQFVILRPTSLLASSNQKPEYVVKFRDLQDGKILIDVTQKKSFDLIRGSCENTLYDISFKLNRQIYRLQHYALEFILDHELFVRLVDSSDYRSSKPSETKRVNAMAKRLRFVFLFIFIIPVFVISCFNFHFQKKYRWNTIGAIE